VKVRQLPGAGSDLEAAVHHYAKVNAALAQALLSEVAHAVERIAQFPRAWHLIGQGLRRHSLRGFPYAVIYRCEGDEIIIVAYAHRRRVPRFWRNRLQDAAWLPLTSTITASPCP
jgi:plasmid stabilization system protein ParE